MTSSEGADAAATIIPYRNPPALIAYYCGVFSLIPCLGLPLGIAAIPLGIVGLRKHRRQPSAKGSVHAWVGILLGSITTILWGAVAALVIVASSTR